MSETVLLFMFGTLITCGGGVIAYVLREITEALKEIRADLQILGKDAEGRFDSLSTRLTTLETQHNVYHK